MSTTARKRGRPRVTPEQHSGRKRELPLAFVRFAELPDDAVVDVKVVALLDDCSESTVWRRVREGDLLPPIKLGTKSTRWRVGDLRQRRA